MAVFLGGCRHCCIAKHFVVPSESLSRSSRKRNVTLVDTLASRDFVRGNFERTSVVKIRGCQRTIDKNKIPIKRDLHFDQ